MKSKPQERPGPPGGKRDLNRRRRVEALVDAGVKLMLAHGLDNVRIDDIAREAGTAKGNFYRYFNDKDALAVAILEPLDTAIRGALDACEAALSTAETEEQLFGAYQGLGLRLAPVFLQHPDAVLLFLQERRGPAVGARVPIRTLADAIEEGSIRLTEVACEHGLLSIEDPRVSALSVIGAVETLVFAVFSGRLDAEPLAITSMLIRLVLDGIRA